MMYIETGGTFLDVVTHRGQIAVVQQKTHGNGPSPMTPRLNKWLKKTSLYSQVSGLFTVYPNNLPLEKRTTPLRDIRKGWERVLRHIRTFAPYTKRILLMGDTQMLRVAIPKIPTDIGDAHGTLFQLDEFIVVPTFHVEYSETEQYKLWMERDAERCLRLTRPAAPLPYLTQIPPGLKPEKVVIDLETTGLDCETDTITALGVQWSDTDRAVITENISSTISWLADCGAREYIGHNLQFDLGFLGPYFQQTTYGKIRDTMIRAKARGELVASLKHLGNVYTSRPGNYAWSSYSFEDPAYVCEDVDVTWRLYKLWQKTTPAVELFEKAISMACEQTRYGSQLDLAALDRLADDGAALAVKLREELTERYGVDPGQQELLTAKLRELGYPLSKKTESGKDALTAEVLEELSLFDILEWRKAMKLDTSFVGKMRKLLRANGTLPHKQVMLGADTGRTTMKDFNWQQAGRKGPTKGLLVSRFVGGKIAAVDLAQAELRVGAMLAGDEVMREWLLQKDAHRVNAANAFEVPFEDVTEDQRNAAKTIVFRLMYGGGATNPGQKRVEAYLRNTFKRLFQKLEQDGNRAMSERRITDFYGKVRNLAGVWDTRGKWGCKRAGINSPIQGLASHVAIEITLRIWELLCGYRSLVLFGVHDSIVLDVHPDEIEYVTQAVQQAFRDLRKTQFAKLPMFNTLPIEGELQYGISWADTKNGAKIPCSSLSGVLC